MIYVKPQFESYFLLVEHCVIFSCFVFMKMDKNAIISYFSISKKGVKSFIFNPGMKAIQKIFFSIYQAANRNSDHKYLYMCGIQIFVLHSFVNNLNTLNNYTIQ